MNTVDDIDAGDNIGNPLTAIHGLFHSQDDSSTGHPMFLNLSIGRRTLGIRTSADGEGIAISGKGHKEFDLGEHGSVVSVDLSCRQEFHELIGGLFIGIERVIDPDSHGHLGLEFRLSSGRLLVLNLGDELFVGRDMPEL